MKEIRDIIAAFDEAARAGKQSALATVVHVDGSSYRRAGARMLITEDGQLTGAISGGCLEGDALRKALLVIREQKPMLVTYDTTDEDDAKLGVGLGCNGIIHILIEPLASGREHPVILFKQMLGKRQQAVLVTLFSLENRKAEQPGTCLLRLPDELINLPVGDAVLQTALLADVEDAFSRQASIDTSYKTANYHYTAFIESIQPAVSLVAVGGGNDVIPLARMAALLGWECTVIDGRANYATQARFPAAQRVLVARPQEVLPLLAVDSRTVFVLMTHNYNYDLAMLQQLVLLSVPYIGVLGPKKKLERMLQEMQEQGILPSQDQLATVFGPVGLDIGAETAEEIALSIVAEIKAVLAHKHAGSLRSKPDAIHPRSRAGKPPAARF